MMATNFPSIWFESKEPNNSVAYISGFYRQWSWEGDKSEDVQVEQLFTLKFPDMQHVKIWIPHE